MHALVDAGADIIELGVPFSDPMADGPVIQRASERALAHGVGLDDVLDLVAAFRERDATTPIVLMGYANPIEAMGEARSPTARATRASTACWSSTIRRRRRPTSRRCSTRAASRRSSCSRRRRPTARIEAVARLARGYVYYVSLKGVTGAAHLDTADVARKLAEIRRHVALPVGVGFGIRDAASARAIAAHADAVVIGSRIIQEIEQGPADDAPARAGAWLAGIRGALDAMARKRAA